MGGLGLGLGSNSSQAVNMSTREEGSHQLQPVAGAAAAKVAQDVQNTGQP